MWNKLYILVLRCLSNFARVRRVRVNNEHPWFTINILSKSSPIQWIIEFIPNKISVFHLAYVIVCHIVIRRQNLYNRLR
jgi:hypothetical protein